MTIGSIFGKERQHPDVASSWNEVGLALNARESLRPIFFSVHLHVDDPVTQNVNMKRLEIKVTIHTLYYMPPHGWIFFALSSFSLKPIFLYNIASLHIYSFRSQLLIAS